MISLDNNEIETVNGGVAAIPSEPTIQDYIDLAEMFAEQTLNDLTGNQVTLPPVF